MITKVIKLDINKNLYEKIKAKQGDTKSRFLLFQLLDGSMPFNLENRSVRAYMLKPDSTEVFNDLIINNRNTGHCTLELTNQVLAVAGIVKIELMIIENDKKITSSIFELQVDKSINSENSIVSTNEFNALLNGLASLSEYDNYKEKAKKVPELEENIQELGSQLDTIENEKADNEKVENIIKQDYSKIFKKIKATNFYVPYNVSEFGDYKSIINNIKRVGNTHISFCIRLSMREKTSNDIYKDVSDDLVLEYVNYAISKGLKIIVKFHVGGAAGGGSANIQPTNTSLWIKSLRDIVLSYCDLLGDKIDIVCLSNECTYQTNQCYDDWKNYNDRVKAKNPKYITTTACTDVEMATTVLYDIVDILGVNLYIGIGGDLNTPQYQRDKNMFVNYSDKENKIRELIYHANKHNKPFYITEVGCTPCVLALKYPAKWDYDEFVRNVEAQKVYYETFLKCFMNMEIIKGVFLWCANDGFTYFDNPAEDVVEKYFMEV